MDADAKFLYLTGKKKPKSDSSWGQLVADVSYHSKLIKKKKVKIGFFGDFDISNDTFLTV